MICFLYTLIFRVLSGFLSTLFGRVSGFLFLLLVLLLGIKNIYLISLNPLQLLYIWCLSRTLGQRSLLELTLVSFWHGYITLWWLLPFFFSTMSCSRVICEFLVQDVESVISSRAQGISVWAMELATCSNNM